MSTPKKKAAPGRQHGKEEKQSYGVATRSKTAFRFDLLPIEGLEAGAARMAIGLTKHGEGNWKHGDVEFVKSLINHAYGHLGDMTRLSPREGLKENAGAVIWGMMVLSWYQANRPKLVAQAMKELREGKVVTTMNSGKKSGNKK